jgi:hypothetical protein
VSTISSPEQLARSARVVVRGLLERDDSVRALVRDPGGRLPAGLARHVPTQIRVMSRHAWHRCPADFYPAWRVASKSTNRLLESESVLSATRTIERLTGSILAIQAGSSTAREG